MDAVQILCPACRADVPVPVSTLTITALPRGGRPGRVSFTCAACHHGGSIPVDDALLVQLRLCGCRVAPDIAARSRHPAGRGRGVVRTPTAPPLGWDDLLDFHELLQEEDWFDQVLVLVG